MNWKSFRGHFAVYYVMLLAIGVGRMLVGQSLADGTQLAVIALISIPIAAIAALFASRVKPTSSADAPRKPRIVASVLIGLAIAAGAVFLAWVLRQV
jgi:uncharacterized membrane protein